MRNYKIDPDIHKPIMSLAPRLHAAAEGVTPSQRGLSISINERNILSQIEPPSTQT